MIERVAEKAVTAPGVSSNQPLNFQLYYGDNAGSAQTINTVYLEDGNPKLDLCLAVFNESSGKITFKAAPPAKLSQVGGSDSASAEKCHFSLRLEKDLQIKPSDISVEPNDWQVNYSQDDHFITIYFLSKKERVLQPKAPDNDSDTVKLIFKNLAAYNGIIKSSNVELAYGSSLLVDSKEVELKPTSSKNAISVTNHPDHRDIPLQFRFIGPNTILNDGTTENSLKLQIINRPTSDNTRPNLLLDKANSKFIVDFEIGGGAEALIPSNKANKIKIATSSTDWNVPPTQNGIGVTVDLKTSSTKNKLGPGEAIELDITGIVTNNPSGVSYMYIAYQNIVGYPDGRLVVPVEKTPLLYRNAQVGIGTKDPEAKLHVSGGDALIGGKLTSAGDALIGGKVGIRTTNPLIDLAIGDQKTGLKQEANGKLAIYTNNAERVRIDENGKVGIGTTAPNEKLEVSGNIKVTGAIQPSAGNGESYGIMFPNNPGSGAGDAAWIRYYARSGEACNLEIGISNDADDHIALMPNAGNVGIGTTSPTHRLHIKGQNSTLRLEGEGSHGQGATLNFGDLQEVYIKEDEDRKLLIHADTRISLESNVGIGTKNPSAKLDVHGDFHIKGQKPIQYRTYTRKDSDQPTFATGYNYPEWIAIVAGFQGSANNSISGFRVFPCVKDGKWIISCDMYGTASERFWDISIIFIKGELVSLESGAWGPPPGISNPS